MGSDGTGSRSIHLRYSGTASFEVQNFAASGETVDDLLNASPSLETLHKLNSTLQKRFEEKLVKLERILQTNLARQVSLFDLIFMLLDLCFDMLFSTCIIWFKAFQMNYPP